MAYEPTRYPPIARSHTDFQRGTARRLGYARDEPSVCFDPGGLSLRRRFKLLAAPRFLELAVRVKHPLREATFREKSFCRKTIRSGRVAC